MNAFLKATIIGGVLFLLPLAIVLLVLGYALRLAAKLAKPISDQLDLHSLVREFFTRLQRGPATEPREW